MIQPSPSFRALLAGALAIVLLLMPFVSGRAQNPSGPPSEIDPAAQALLNRAIQGLGGPAFLGFRTMSTQGRAFSISDGVTQGFVLYQSWSEFPAKRRLSYGLAKRSKAVTLINDGDQGWELDRYGLIEQSPKEIRAWRLANRYSLENLLRVRARETGVLIQKGGDDLVDNHPAQILDIVDSRQVAIKLYLDSQSHQPVEIAYRIMNPETHEWDEYSDIYSDYQSVGGVQTATHLVRYLNGDRVAETFRTQIRYNETYPAGYFEPRDQ
ncbi:MAG: hypothetical protein ACRD3D_15560 [Terriglobia bacterium]